MKKFIVCLMAFAAIAFVSCTKDDPEAETANPAKEFVGTYSLSGTATVSLPVVGQQSVPVPSMDCTVALKGDKGDVTLTINDKSIDGYVNDSGLHIDPFNYNTEILNTSLAFTVTVPTIAKPDNGRVSTTASLVASVSGVAVNGTADVIGVRK